MYEWRMTRGKASGKRTEVCRQFLQGSTPVDGNDVHFAAHQGILFSPAPDLLPEGKPVFRRAQHGSHDLESVPKESGSPEFHADLVDDQPAIGPRNLLHRDAQGIEQFASPAFKISKIGSMIDNALRISIFQIDTKF
jgi:hypothetical protein